MCSSDLTPDDLVLIAGKGHESTIEWADHAEPWDDRAAAREAIAARFGDRAATVNESVALVDFDDEEFEETDDSEESEEGQR